MTQFDERLVVWGANARKARGGKPLAAVADLAGLSVSSLSRIERGRQHPTDDTKIRIAKALGRSVARLFPLEITR